MNRSVEIPEEVGKAARKAAMQCWVTGSSDTTQMLASVNAALAVVAEHLAPAGDGGQLRSDKCKGWKQ